PSYIVTSFVAGNNVSVEFINSLSLDEQQAIGKTIGTFAYELHSSISVDEEIAFREAAQLGEQFDESWQDYFHRVVAEGSYALPEQRSIAREYYDEWMQVNKAHAAKVVVHDDLH